LNIVGVQLVTMIIPFIKLLRKNNYSSIVNDFEESYMSHPNYPSLFAITDTLHLLKIENLAARISKEHFNELPSCFIAEVDKEWVFVERIKAGFSVHLEKRKLSWNDSDFLARWTGSVVCVEQGKEESQNGKVPAAIVRYIGPVLLIFGILSMRDVELLAILLLISSTAGSIIAVEIIRNNFGFKDIAVDRLCNIGTNTSCAITTGKETKITSWLNVSDLPLLFFLPSVLALLNNSLTSSVIVGALSV